MEPRAAEGAWAKGRAGGELDAAAGFTIRELESREELEACVELQQEVWGPAFGECAPASLLAVCSKMGGVVAGAFEEERLVAFVFGITGLQDGVLSHWSHMLGVKPEIRNGGLGFSLKAYQRDRLLAEGVKSVRWTFDPLESRNAHLNLSKLGIVVREYVPEMYGESASPLHGGIGTDRFVALWKLDDDRVVQRMRGIRTPVDARDVEGIPEVVAAELLEDGLPIPILRPAPSSADAALVSIPVDIQALKDASPELALRWRRATRLALAGLIGRGFEVRELVRDASVSRYLLERRAG